MKFQVYMLRCSDGKLYTGHTGNIERRLREHSEGRGGRFTRSRLPIKLVYAEEHATRSGAMVREREIKKIARADKIELIESQNEKQYD